MNNDNYIYYLFIQNCQDYPNPRYCFMTCGSCFWLFTLIPLDPTQQSSAPVLVPPMVTNTQSNTRWFANAFLPPVH